MKLAWHADTLHSLESPAWANESGKLRDTSRFATHRGSSTASLTSDLTLATSQTPLSQVSVQTAQSHRATSGVTFVELRAPLSLPTTISATPVRTRPQIASPRSLSSHTPSRSVFPGKVRMRRAMC